MTLDVRGRLIDAGEHLPSAVRDEILALGDAAVSPLLGVLEDPELQREESPGEGLAPVHAAVLLGELRAPAAVGPMLRILAEDDWRSVLHDRALVALRRIGAPALEPTLRAHAETTEREHRSTCCSVLGGLGVEDARVFDVLVAALREDAQVSAMALASYGDPRAIPHLARAFDDYEVEPASTPFAHQTLVELRAAIERLGGVLTAEQEAKHDGAMRLVVPVRRPPRPAPGPFRPRCGRNDPCWCGSGKKYKKCHLAIDEDEHRGGGRPRLPADAILRMTVTLLDSEPPIWRRIEVPASITLSGLHYVIQRVMDWDGDHAHAFDIDGVEYGAPHAGPFRRVVDESVARLGDLVREGDAFHYEYDFGDSWEHGIVVESIDGAETGARYPRCLDGRRACPPDDCGGIGAYRHMLYRRSHGEQPERLRDFDPDAFDVDAVDARLAPRAG